DQQVAGPDLADGLIAAVPRRRLDQRVAAACLRPIRRIGSGLLRLDAIDRSPHTAYEPQAVAAHALARLLMPVGRAGPGQRLGDDQRREARLCLLHHGVSVPPSNSMPSVT